MELETRKIAFVQEFLRLQNEEIISGLEKLLRKKKTALLEQDDAPMTMHEYNAEMEQAEQDSEAGRMIELSDLKVKMLK
jgi:hypothetical protein